MPNTTYPRNGTDTADTSKTIVVPYSPPKETVPTIADDPEEIKKHINAAKMLLPLAAPSELEFLYAYMFALDKKGYVGKPGENIKAIKRGLDAAAAKMPIITAIRDLEKFLAASYRGSFKTDVKSDALRENARKPRTRISDPRNIRQPLTVNRGEMDIISQASAKTGIELTNFIRDAVLKVCTGEFEFVAPTVTQTGKRGKKYQVRWSEKEWESVTKKASELYDSTLNKRGHSGVLVRDATIAAAKMALEK